MTCNVGVKVLIMLRRLVLGRSSRGYKNLVARAACGCCGVVALVDGVA